MKFLQNFFEFYINSSIHVALAVVALVHLTNLQFGFTGYWTLDLFVFLGTITAYNFVKYAPIAKLYHRRLTTSLKVIQVFSLFCFCMLLLVSFRMPLGCIALSFAFTGLTILYALPIVVHGKSLRTIPGLKIFVIALCWSGVSVVLPIQFVKYPLDWDVAIVALQRFLWVLILILPFEIRDIQHDDNALKTIPQRLGIPKTKSLGVLLGLLFMLLIGFRDGIAYPIIISELLFIAISVVVLWRTNQVQSKFFCSFWVESLPSICFGIQYCVIMPLFH